MNSINEKLVELIDLFNRNISQYNNKDYKEEQIKTEFLNRFFKLLGWDINNEAGAAPQYKEVIFEDSIKTSTGTRAPDYCFRLGGTPLFFVEAKKPSSNILINRKYSYQIRRYIWSAKLPIGILTNFKDFVVYESKQRPNINDSPSRSRILKINFREYNEKWEEIYNKFSKEAVIKGFFDKFFKDNKKKSGTSEVDVEFLKDIEGWRDDLAKNIALRNTSLNASELNYSVQKIIDRVIFLRMCEDRGIEPYRRMYKLIQNKEIYLELYKIFQEAGNRYNSGLFHFNKEKNRKTFVDNLTINLIIDDKILKKIIRNLYYPDSPYEFSVLQPEILGQVYEQFIGKTIRLTDAHRAVVEFKPEIKKQGGVYYTPKFIVDYIIENTVKILCDNLKSPNKISKIRILDPACGSGSFLLGAYSILLKYHLDYYLNYKNPDKYKDLLFQNKTGVWSLTIKEKKRILLNNIYGVDIDSQAVEVTKLSLLLKILEGEGREMPQRKLWYDRALPDLEDNIKCGNSLVDFDNYDGSIDIDAINEEEWNRINIFDWKKEFMEIFKDGKFDIIIGNPPYMKTQTLKEYHPIVVEYLKSQYSSAKKGNYDIYIVFIERAMQLLKEKGYLGYIVPHKFFNASYGKNLRKYISQNGFLQRVIHFSDYQIFKNVSTYTCLIFLQNQKNNVIEAAKFDSSTFNPDMLKSIKFININSNEWTENPWNIQSEDCSKILQKINKFPKLFDVTTNIFQGPKTGADNVFIFELISENNDIASCFSTVLNRKFQIEKGIIHKYVKGKYIQNYFIDYSAIKYTIFPYHKDGTVFSKNDFKNKFPLAYEYLKLKENKDILCAREKGKYCNPWWVYSRPQNMKIVFNHKILTPFNAFNNSFALDDKGDFIFSAGVSGAYGILLKPEFRISYEYLLGILNSKLVLYFIRNTSTCLRGGYYSYENKYIKNIPIRLIAEKSPYELDLYNKICEKVKSINDLNIKIPSIKLPNEIDGINRNIQALKNQIDQIVFKLYNLSDKEINLIEEELD